MSCRRHAGDVVALHRLVDGVSVVDQEGDTLPVPPIRAQPNVGPVTEHHDVSRLPLLSVSKSLWLLVPMNEAYRLIS